MPPGQPSRRHASRAEPQPSPFMAMGATARWADRCSVFSPRDPSFFPAGKSTRPRGTRAGVANRSPGYGQHGRKSAPFRGQYGLERQHHLERARHPRRPSTTTPAARSWSTTRRTRGPGRRGAAPPRPRPPRPRPPSLEVGLGAVVVAAGPFPPLEARTLPHARGTDRLTGLTRARDHEAHRRGTPPPRRLLAAPRPAREREPITSSGPSSTSPTSSTTWRRGPRSPPGAAAPPRPRRSAGPREAPRAPRGTRPPLDHSAPPRPPRRAAPPRPREPRSPRPARARPPSSTPLSGTARASAPPMPQARPAERRGP